MTADPYLHGRGSREAQPITIQDCGTRSQLLTVETLLHIGVEIVLVERGEGITHPLRIMANGREIEILAHGRPEHRPEASNELRAGGGRMSTELVPAGDALPALDRAKQLIRAARDAGDTDTLHKLARLGDMAQQYHLALDSREDALAAGEIWFRSMAALGGLDKTEVPHGGNRRSSSEKTDLNENPVHVLPKDRRTAWRKWGTEGARAEYVDDVIDAVREDEDAAGFTLALVQRVWAVMNGGGTTESPPPAVGTFATLVIDPPWPVAKIARDVRPDQADAIDYGVMTEDELRAWKPTDHCDVAADAHLYLWTTHKCLPLALELAGEWGFRYQCLLTWVKNVGITPFSWMYSTEHVVFARRGSLELRQLGRRLDFAAKVREHSRKPDEFYELVREVSPGPRIDMFARESHAGFDTWGNETEKLNAA